MCGPSFLSFVKINGSGSLPCYRSEALRQTALTAIPVKLNLGNSNILTKDHKATIVSLASCFSQKGLAKVTFLNFATRLNHYELH